MCSLRLGEAEQGRWSWKERGGAWIERALRDKDRGVERGSPLISGRSEHRRKGREREQQRRWQTRHALNSQQCSTNVRGRDRRREKEGERKVK